MQRNLILYCFLCDVQFKAGGAGECTGAEAFAPPVQVTLTLPLEEGPLEARGAPCMAPARSWIRT